MTDNYYRIEIDSTVKCVFETTYITATPNFEDFKKVAKDMFCKDLELCADSVYRLGKKSNCIYNKVRLRGTRNVLKIDENGIISFKPGLSTLYKAMEHYPFTDNYLDKAFEESGFDEIIKVAENYDCDRYKAVFYGPDGHTKDVIPPSPIAKYSKLSDFIVLFKMESGKNDAIKGSRKAYFFYSDENNQSGVWVDENGHKLFGVTWRILDTAVRTVNRHKIAAQEYTVWRE